MKTNKALFWASFMTLIAAGMGFAIRGGVLADWGNQFGFTKTQLGTITGGGLTGFGVMIILCSLFVDKVGYKPLMIVAFLLHVSSAIVTLAATPIYAAYGQAATYWCLWIGMFMFALANGMCEAVINPLVATLFPKQKTHYLNILHAGWPGGLILGGLLGYMFVGRDAVLYRISIGERGLWEVPMAFFLVPTFIYGAVMIKEKFPLSEARAAGVRFGEMLTQFAAPVFLMLLVLHAMVGYVELGTDSWITNIMEHVLSGNAILVLVYTSGIMFVLRFFAGPIVEHINPIGLLFVSSVLGCLGLYWLGSLGAEPTVIAIFVAATVYGFGKAFLWPTMLGVVGERFPRGGALTMGTIGGVGMLSAGLLGGPGIGYTQDRFASQGLQQTSEDAYEEYAATGYFSVALDEFVPATDMKDGEWPAEYGEVVQKKQPNRFLFFSAVTGLDGSKVGDLKDELYTLRKEQPDAKLSAEQQQVIDAELYGGSMALKVTAAIPLTMAVGYLILVIYFWTQGGYKIEEIHREEQLDEGEKLTGGVKAAVR